MREYQAKENSRYGVIGLTIRDLRSKGWSYNRIQRELGCARSTISFHCGKDQKIKSRERKSLSRARKTVPAVGKPDFKGKEDRAGAMQKMTLA